LEISDFERAINEIENNSTLHKEAAWKEAQVKVPKNSRKKRIIFRIMHIQNSHQAISFQLVGYVFIIIPIGNHYGCSGFNGEVDIKTFIDQ